MNTRDKPSFAESEQNEELIGVLTAISVVSKRLARQLAALEYRREVKPRGGKIYGTNERVVRCCGRD